MAKGRQAEGFRRRAGKDKRARVAPEWCCTRFICLAKAWPQTPRNAGGGDCKKPLCGPRRPVACRWMKSQISSLCPGAAFALHYSLGRLAETVKTAPSEGENPAPEKRKRKKSAPPYRLRLAPHPAACDPQRGSTGLRPMLSAVPGHGKK